MAGPRAAAIAQLVAAIRPYHCLAYAEKNILGCLPRSSTLVTKARLRRDCAYRHSRTIGRDVGVNNSPRRCALGINAYYAFSRTSNKEVAMAATGSSPLRQRS